MTIGENMKFVYSNWYIVIGVLLVLIVASIVAFVLMDKKDRELIQDFVKKNSEPAETLETSSSESVEQTKIEEKKE